MADKTTFIKLDRNIINWRWFKNSKVLSVFIWLLIKANIKDGYFQREKIERGSLVTSNQHIADGCGLSMQNIRTALADLEETGEIVRNQRNHYQIITVVNYESYQSDLRKSVGQLTSNSQATNKQLTTIKEYNNIRIQEKKNIKKKTSPTTLEGVGDVPKAKLLKPIDEGTVEDIPDEFKDICPTYADYVRLRNR